MSGTATRTSEAGISGQGAEEETAQGQGCEVERTEGSSIAERPRTAPGGAAESGTSDVVIAGWSRMVE